MERKFIAKEKLSFYQRFTECWIPDEEGEDNLAGELSHPL